MARPKAKIDLAELEKLCAMQCTDEEIAAFFGVSTKTVERRRNSAHQSDNAKHNPSRSGSPARIWASMTAISWRQRAIHATFLSLAISSKVLPSPSSLAFFPPSVCHRCTITSTYLGSNSMP